MNTRMNKYPNRPPSTRGIAAILVSGIAIVILAVTAQAFNRLPAAGARPEAATALELAAPRVDSYQCSECGVIESIRTIKAPADAGGSRTSAQTAAGKRGAIEAESPRYYEITIRLRNGTTRVIRDSKPAQWKRGEPVTLIDGADL